MDIPEKSRGVRRTSFRLLFSVLSLSCGLLAGSSVPESRAANTLQELDQDAYGCQDEECWYLVYFKTYDTFVAQGSTLESKYRLSLNWYVPYGPDLDESIDPDADEPGAFLERLKGSEARELAQATGIRDVQLLPEEKIIKPSLLSSMFGGSNRTDGPTEAIARLAAPTSVPNVRAELFRSLNDLLPPDRTDLRGQNLVDLLDRAIIGPEPTTDQMLIDLEVLEPVLFALSTQASTSTDSSRLVIGEATTAGEDDITAAGEQVPRDMAALARFFLEAIQPLVEESEIVRLDSREYPTLRNSTTSWVIQSGRLDERTIFGHSLRGEGEVVGLIDDFLDLEHCFLDGGGPPGGLHRKIVSHRAIFAGDPSRHGTFAAGILAGAHIDTPRDVRNGQAPAARIAFSSLWDFVGRGKLPTTLFDTLTTLHDCYQARVFSNSWGNDQSDYYTNWAYDIDLFTWYKEEALVVFAVSNRERVKSPENAKNTLAVGASKQAEFFNQRGSGGCGPTRDRRRKPEIFAPGCRIRSAIVDTSCDLGRGPVQHDLAGYRSKRHETDCSTSWAAPAVAGGAALVRQYFQEGWYPTGERKIWDRRDPSGALVKAILLNGTVDMTDVVQSDRYRLLKYPNDIEGWGRLLLDDALFFAHDDRRLVAMDEKRSYGLGFRPGSPRRTYVVRSHDAEVPLKVTLAWTEPPPAPHVRYQPVVNDLDLRVEPIDCPQPRYIYLGNDFTPDGVSIRRPIRNGIDLTAFQDRRNNVEQVVIPHPCGSYRIVVDPRRIWVGRHSPQGYAVVATGAITKTPP